METLHVFSSEINSEWEVDHDDIFLRPRSETKLPPLINERGDPSNMMQEPPTKRFRLEDMVDKSVWSLGFLQHFNRVHSLRVLHFT